MGRRPRIAAVEHPFGRPYGDVDDAETQISVLRSALSVFDRAKAPGHVEHLPHRWHEDPKDTKSHPAEPSPMIAPMKSRKK